jgi:pilus assembly protein CpaE
MLLTLGNEEGLSDKVKVIINRAGSDFMEGDISLKKAEETIGKPIFWQIPNDAKPMLSSRVAPFSMPFGRCPTDSGWRSSSPTTGG